MTLAPTEHPTGSAPDPSVDGADDTVQPVVRRRRADQRRRRDRKVLAVQSGLTAFFVVALVGLVWAGWSAALRITGGSDDKVTDPAAPGYVAAVKPTAVTLLAFTSDEPPAEGSVAPPTSEDGQHLTGMLLVVDRGDGYRTISPIPAFTTLWEFEDAQPASAAEVFADGGIDVLRIRLGTDLSFGTTAALTVPTSVIADLAGRTGPVTIELADDVLQGTSDEDAAVRYAAGELTLEPEQVAEFLSFYGYRDSESNRALRQELVWKALLGEAGAGEQDDAADTSSTAAASDPASGSDSDDVVAASELLDEVVSDGGAQFSVVPMLAVPLNVTPPVTLYRIDQMSMPQWVAAEVPFPISAFPGQRARVELLNGTTDPATLQTVAPKVVGANGEVAFTGNAESFDVAQTRVEWVREDARVAAEQIATALGITATETTTDADTTNVDVVVVTGADQMGQG